MFNVNDSELRKIVESIRVRCNVEGDLSKMMNGTFLGNFSSFGLKEDDEEKGFSCGGPLAKMAEEYANSYHLYCVGVVCFFGTIANILNIIILTRKDMISAPINRILTALAVADMLLMLEYIPFALYYHLVLLGTREFPYHGAVYMLFHIHITHILHTISICLTLTLAIWRYLAIGYPERNHILCSEKRCKLAIILSYLLPVILCAPTYLTIKIASTKVYEDKVYTLYHTTLSDMFQNDKNLLMINFWVYAVCLKLLPCCILTAIICWLIRTLFRAKKRKQVLRGYDSYPLSEMGSKKKSSKTERRADRTTKMLVAVLLLFLITEFPQGLFAFFIGLEGKTLFLECYQKYGDVMDILALFNGAINFILYCCMNRMFRTTFGQLFKRKILAKWHPAPPSDIHTTIHNGTNTTQV